MIIGDVTFAKTSCQFGSNLYLKDPSNTHLFVLLNPAAGPLFTLQTDNVNFNGNGHKFDVSPVNCRNEYSDYNLRVKVLNIGMVKAAMVELRSLILSSSQ